MNDIGSRARRADCTAAILDHRLRRVFRFRSFASAHGILWLRTIGIKGTLAILMFSSAALGLKFLQEPAVN